MLLAGVISLVLSAVCDMGKSTASCERKETLHQQPKPVHWIVKTLKKLPDNKTLNAALRTEFLPFHQIPLGLSTLLSLRAKPVASQGSTPLSETLLGDRTDEGWAHLDPQPWLGDCLGSPNSDRISPLGFYQQSLQAPCTGHVCPLSTTPQQPLACRVPFPHPPVPLLGLGGSQWEAERQEQSFIYSCPLFLYWPRFAVEERKKVAADPQWAVHRTLWDRWQVLANPAHP